MTPFEHNSRQSLEVRHLAKPLGKKAHGIPAGAQGWFVVRICPCHTGEAISVPFRTRAEADRCLEALDDDARRSCRNQTAAV